MRVTLKIPRLWVCLVLVLAAACSPAAASVLPTASPDAPTLTARPTLTPTAAPIQPPVVSSPSPQIPAASPAPTRTPPPPTATPCPPELCVHTGMLVFQRPIAAPGRDSVDKAYRFGSTQGGQRDPHHGVEFLNPAKTPVLAAGKGVVVVAGDDRTTFFGPYSYFYGNLVVIEHPRTPGLPHPVYTLYAHLEEIQVEVGQLVQAGQQVGLVGMSGVATGHHLHFEVRVGENSYKSSRNPELWLAPPLDDTGQPMGAIAGRILDTYGSLLEVENIVIGRLPAPGEPPDFEVYLGTYSEKALLGQPPYEESFGAGDLPAGWYRVSFAQFGFQSQEVQVFPGQVTVVTFVVGEP